MLFFAFVSVASPRNFSVPKMRFRPRTCCTICFTWLLATSCILIILIAYDIKQRQMRNSSFARTHSVLSPLVPSRRSSDHAKDTHKIVYAADDGVQKTGRMVMPKPKTPKGNVQADATERERGWRDETTENPVWEASSANSGEMAFTTTRATAMGTEDEDRRGTRTTTTMTMWTTFGVI